MICSVGQSSHNAGLVSRTARRRAARKKISVRTRIQELEGSLGLLQSKHPDMDLRLPRRHLRRAERRLGLRLRLDGARTAILAARARIAAAEAALERTRLGYFKDKALTMASGKRLLAPLFVLVPVLNAETGEEASSAFAAFERLAGLVFRIQTRAELLHWTTRGVIQKELEAAVASERPESALASILDEVESALRPAPGISKPRRRGHPRRGRKRRVMTG